MIKKYSCWFQYSTAIQYLQNECFAQQPKAMQSDNQKKIQQSIISQPSISKKNVSEVVSDKENNSQLQRNVEKDKQVLKNIQSGHLKLS